MKNPQTNHECAQSTNIINESSKIVEQKVPVSAAIASALKECLAESLEELRDLTATARKEAKQFFTEFDQQVNKVKQALRASVAARNARRRAAFQQKCQNIFDHPVQHLVAIVRNTMAFATQVAIIVVALSLLAILYELNPDLVIQVQNDIMGVANTVINFFVEIGTKVVDSFMNAVNNVAEAFRLPLRLFGLIN